METVDILIGVFAVVAVVGSVVGAALYEPSDLQDFRVTFTSHSDSVSASGEASGGTVAGSQSDTMVLRHEIAQANVTELTFTVSLSRAAPAVTTLQWSAELFAPGGTSVATDDGSMTDSATIELAAPDDHLATMPEETTQSGASANAVGNEAADRYADANATGEWRVEVTVTFPQGAAPTGTTVTGDSEAAYRYYEATVTSDLDVSGVA